MVFDAILVAAVAAVAAVAVLVVVDAAADGEVVVGWLNFTRIVGDEYVYPAAER